MYRYFLSWRYFLARRTNLIGMVGIFVAVAALILILSIMTGFLEESRKTVRGSLSDILIEPVFRHELTQEELPPDPFDLLAAVRAQPGVVGAAAELQWGGIITQSGKNQEQYERILSSSTHKELLAVQLVGVDVRGFERLTQPLLRTALLPWGPLLPPSEIQDEFSSTDFLAALTRSAPEDEDAFFSSSAPVKIPLLPFLPPADYEPLGRPKAGAIIGQQLFRNLGLRRGDVIQIATAVPDPDNGEWKVNNRKFVVAGTSRSGENETDLSRIYLERTELIDFLRDTRRFTQVLVRVEDFKRDGNRIRDELRESLAAAGVIQGGPYARQEVRTWEEFRGNLLGAIENERVLMAIMLSLVLVVAGFTIFAILSMMVTEKRRDIGILCALGGTPKGILDVFLMIALWDALIGGFFGAVLGTWGAIRIDSIERWLSKTFGVQIFNRDVYLFDHIPSIVQPMAVGVIVFGAFVCALLFAAIPAWRAARLDPLEALRYE